MQPCMCAFLEPSSKSTFNVLFDKSCQDLWQNNVLSPKVSECVSQYGACNGSVRVTKKAVLCWPAPSQAAGAW